MMTRSDIWTLADFRSSYFNRDLCECSKTTDEPNLLLKLDENFADCDWLRCFNFDYFISLQKGTENFIR